MLSMSPSMPLLLIALLCCCLPSAHSFGHLPRAYTPPSLNGTWNGNASRPDAIAELQTLASYFLNDPTSYKSATTGQTVNTQPWKRQVLQVSSYGAVANSTLR